MGFGLPNPIPAVPSAGGGDQYLIIGIDGMDAIVIDQDGDIRPITISDLRTKWVYIADPGVWHSTQMTLEDETYEEPDLEPAPKRRAAGRPNTRGG